MDQIALAKLKDEEPEEFYLITVDINSENDSDENTPAGRQRTKEFALLAYRQPTPLVHTRQRLFMINVLITVASKPARPKHTARKAVITAKRIKSLHALSRKQVALRVARLPIKVSLAAALASSMHVITIAPLPVSS